MAWAQAVLSTAAPPPRRLLGRGLERLLQAEAGWVRHPDASENYFITKRTMELFFSQHLIDISNSYLIVISASS